MGSVLVKALVLVVVAVGVGFAHYTLKPNSVMLELPKVQNVAPTGPTTPPAATGPSGRPSDFVVRPGLGPNGNPVPPGATGTTPTPGPTGNPAPTGTSAAPAANSEYHITIARAKELYDKKQAIFIDARNYDEYKTLHIPGSMHIDKKYFDGIGPPKKVREYLPGQMVVIYCHGEDCTDSEAVAKRLIALKLQIGPIHIIKEGLPGWQKAGHPVEVGGQDPFPV